MITANINEDGLRQSRAVHPPFASKGNYVIVQHGELLDTLRRQITEQGWLPHEEAFALSPDEAEALVYVEVKLAVETEFNVRPWVGVVNSNARRRRSMIYAGLTDCGVVCPLWRQVLYIHDARLNPLEWQLAQALDNLSSRWPMFPVMLNGMAEKRLSQPEADLLCHAVFKKGYIVWSRMNHVIEARRPDDGGETAWTLFSSLARAVMKGPPIIQTPMTDQFAQLYGIRQLITEW